ncbi:MAG: phenylalanine--tRNA ligase beta subunit-related protein, partial [Candidatus Caldarchaeum sp.]
FDPRRIRRTSKRLGLRSESSFRFERGVDPEGVTRALDRAASLIAELAGGEVARGLVDVYPKPVKPREIELSVSALNSTLGTSLAPDEIEGILLSLGMDVKQKEPSTFYVSVPTFRVDVEREIDLVEEVARLHGYDNIPTTTPLAPMTTRGGIDARAVEERVRGVLIASGFIECINYSFEDPKMLSL